MRGNVAPLLVARSGWSERLEDFTVAGNGALPTCQAEALLARIDPADVRGTATIAGNDDAGTCP